VYFSVLLFFFKQLWKKSPALAECCQWADNGTHVEPCCCLCM